MKNLTLFAMLMVFGNPAIGADSPVVWKFKPGQTLRYKYRLRNDVQSRATGQAQVAAKGGVELSLDLNWLVDRVGEDGTANIIQKIDHIRMLFYKEYTSGIRDEAIYDSADRRTIDNQWSMLMQESLRPLLGEPIAIKVTALGHLTGVKLPDKAATAWKTMPFLTAEPHPFSALFSAEKYGLLFTPVLPELPGKPLGLSDTWRSSWSEQGGQLQLIDTYSVSEIVQPLVKVTGKTEAALSGPKVFPLLSASELCPQRSITSDEAVEFDKGKLEQQTGSVTLSFDTSAGHLIVAKRELAYRINSEYRAKEGGPRGGTVNGSFHLTTSMERVP